MPQNAPSLLKSTYRETLDLMVETRNYLAYNGRAERVGLDQLDRLKTSCEAFRVTSRLTQVMAWLMAQRAVQAGEISLDEAITQFALNADDVCLDESLHSDEAIPRGLRSLMDRSHQLYCRISRLEEMVRQRMN